ncbi:HNH endonuclease [Streptomyces bathyalis]|uniref:HNH endonuclease n=1 Tax=Streptomyces bathyalis TaxID=2710756 RepID=A0A7T1TDB4_9ACTN|nr:HNH endonuclease [Streptomyces bathyalis]
MASGCQVPGQGGGSNPGKSESPTSRESPTPTHSEGGPGPGSSDGSGAVSPFANPEGSKRGLAPVTSESERERARALIATVRTKGRGPRTGYEREAFGYAWKDTVDGVPLGRNGCDTRNDILARDGRKLVREQGSDCVVVSMTLHDPYTGRTVEWRKQRAMEVQIDHIMPLSYDWQMGAARWSESKRERIANDPLNLLPVDGSSNSAKRDSGPASWLPPDKRIRCAYSVRFAQVALEYELPVTAPDKRMMLRQCGG